VTYVCRRDIAESFRAFCVEIQFNLPSLVAITGACMTDMLPGEICFLFYKQSLLPWLLVFFCGDLVNFDPVVRRDHFFAGINRAQAITIVRINHPKLEFRHARKLIARFLNLRCVESRNLDQNSIAADRADNWFASTEVIDAFANDLDCLVEHPLGHFFIATLQPDKKGGAALNIEAERDLLLRRPDRDNAGDDKHQHERHGQQPFPRPLIGGEIPPE
jgi:hypothetical protein